MGKISVCEGGGERGPSVTRQEVVTLQQRNSYSVFTSVQYTMENSDRRK